MFLGGPGQVQLTASDRLFDVQSSGKRVLPAAAFPKPRDSHSFSSHETQFALAMVSHRFTWHPKMSLRWGGLLVPTPQRCSPSTRQEGTGATTQHKMAYFGTIQVERSSEPFRRATAGERATWGRARGRRSGSGSQKGAREVEGRLVHSC